MSKKRIPILGRDEADSLLKEELIRPVPLFISKKWRNYTDKFKFIYLIKNGTLRMYYYVRVYHKYNYKGQIIPSRRRRK